LTFLRTQKDFLVKLLKHIGTSGILDIILKIISCEEYGDGFGVVQVLILISLILFFDFTQLKLIRKKKKKKKSSL